MTLGKSHLLRIVYTVNQHNAIELRPQKIVKCLTKFRELYIMQLSVELTIMIFCSL